MPENTHTTPNTNQVPVKDSGVKNAEAGFVLGIIAVIAWIVPITGIIISIGGIVRSSLGLQSSKKDKARTGLILSIIGLCLTLLAIIFNMVINA